VLRPLSRKDVSTWNQIRQINRGWLHKWDATVPEPNDKPNFSFLDMLVLQRQLVRRGLSLPWALAWDDGWPERPQRRPPMIGQVTVSGIARGAAQSATIGYWIDQRWAGHDLVPLAVALAADYCFQSLKLHRLEIDILPENQPSHRVVEKLGFKFDCQRRSLLHIAGVWRDHEAYVMTADEAPVSLVEHFLAGRQPPTADWFALE